MEFCQSGNVGTLIVVLQKIRSGEKIFDSFLVNEIVSTSAMKGIYTGSRL